MPNGDEPRVMVDPSLLMQPAALDWLEAVPDLFVVSEAFRGQLADGQIGPSSPLLAPEHAYGAKRNTDRVLKFIDRAEVFSGTNNPLADPFHSVTELLMEGGDGPGFVYADEWVYLETHSVMFASLRHPLDAFRRAGVAVTEYGRRLLEEMIDVVIPKRHQDRYNARTLIATGLLKWVIVVEAGAIGSVIGGPGGGAIAAGPTIPALRAFDP